MAKTRFTFWNKTVYSKWLSANYFVCGACGEKKRGSFLGLTRRLVEVLNGQPIYVNECIECRKIRIKLKAKTMRADNRM